MRPKVKLRIKYTNQVAVPVRGADCVGNRYRDFIDTAKGCRPREGCGLRLQNSGGMDDVDIVAVPVRGADCVGRHTGHLILKADSCRPREGCGLRLSADDDVGDDVISYKLPSP